ncbi:hypothetical protein [Cupriavidus agavae]|uniref:Uncharacterized protein n=1 Tax=Cupriavidus agavae TaxID=1001822 RepID=A0A4Q7S618_9BURK|nr:hypothetical protein [Cupriavidus agavae]RZT41775.1 hypothetical protein EV147_0779 [Cupriavidus agavae]
MSLSAVTQSRFLETSRRYLLSGAIGGAIGGAITGALMVATPLGDTMAASEGWALRAPAEETATVTEAVARAFDAMSGGLMARL